MANEFVTRTGLIVSGSTFLPAATSASKGYILSFDTSTKEVYYMSTSSVTVTVPGSDTQVIYNNGGAFGASPNFVFSGSNIGIGTSSPGFKLEVSGSAKVTYLQIQNNGYAGGLPTTPEIYSPASATLAISAGGAERLRIDSNGNLGVGISSPEAKLDVSGSIKILYPTGKLYAAATPSFYGEITPFNASGQMIFNVNYPEGNIIFQSGSVEVARFKDAKLGIGTTSPNVTLEANGKVRSTRSGITSQYLEIDGGTSGAVYLTAAGASKPLVIQNNNTTQSDIWFDQAVASPYLWLQAGTEKMRLDASGNLGIGTTSPLGQLDIRTTSGDTIFRSVVANGGTATSNDLSIKQDFITGVAANYLWSNSSYILGIGRNGGTMPTTEAEATALSSFVINSSGNVGIGTTSPAQQLHLTGNILLENNQIIRWKNTSGAERNIFSLDTNNQLQVGGSIDAIRFLTNDSSERMRITSTGNVGINKTAPSTTLDVSGSVLISGSLTVSGSSTFTNIGPAVFTGSITQNASTASFGGLVGIGTTTPGFKLDVNGTINVAAGNYYRVGSTAVAFVSGNEVQYGNQGGSDFVTISTGTTEKFRITTGGNVGIGTTTPSEILDVQKAGTVAVRVYNTSSTADAYFNAKNSTGDAFFGINATGQYLYTSNNIPTLFYNSGSERMRITNAGDVGIGTNSPTAKLDIRTDTGIFIKGATSDTDGRVSIIPASGGRQYDLRNYGSSFGIKDASADVVRMFFHNNGNTGIANGTTTPTATLEVNGNVKATSFTGSFSGSVSAPGSTTQIVYNSGGALAADSGLVYSGSAVGIGTATPSSGTKLQVDGNIYSNNVGGNSFTLNSFGANYGFISTTANNTFSLGYGPSLGTLGTPVLTWNSSGNVGIGTTTPSTALTVVGAISSSGATFVGGNLSVGTTYNSFAANIAGTTYVIGASVWVNDGYGYANASSGNTGFFPSGSSDIRINSAGTTRMFIASGSGNVGIGTTSPLNLLHVSQASANTIFRLGNNASYDQFIYFNGGNDWSLGMDYSNSNAFVLSNASSIGTNDRLVVTTGGNVGIGTTAPGAKLDIVSTGAGTEGLRVDGTGGGFAFVVKAGSDYTSHIRAGATVGVNYFTTPPSNGLIVEGNVGIGTTSPISGQGTPLTLASSTGYVGLTLSGSGAYSHLWQLYASGDGSSSKFFGIYDSTNALYRLVTTSTGNVGIGTTSPGAKLTVYSDTTSDGILVDVLSKPRITLRDRGNSDTILGTGDYGLDDFFIDTYSGNALAIKGSTRNVGIGTTTPGEVLEVVGNIRANVSNGGGFMLTGASASGLVRAGATGLALRTNTTDRLTIDNSGNVGIGTTSPSAKLDVYRALQTDTITRANAAAYFWGADVGLAIGQYASGPYGTWLQSLKYDNNNSFPLSLNPSGGNVGIGTSNPLYNLEVSGSGYYGGNLTVAGTITAQKLNVQQVTSSVIYSSGSNVFGNSLANTQTFTGSLQVTGSTHYLLGNVGIGITSPTAKLHFGPGNWASDPGAKNYSGAAINTSGSDIATGRIFLQGYDFTGTDTVGINNETNRLVLFNYTDSRYLQIWDHTGDTYLAPAAGNVGIGTTSPYPSARLQVKTATDINVAIQTGTTNLSGIKINAFNDAGDTNIPLELNGSILSLKTGETERMHITSGGNVVINGTTAINPASNRGNLTINGTSAILNFGISNTESGYIFHNGTNLDIAQVLAQPLRFLTTNAERMRIDASGNVGIGTSSPVSKLHVVGEGDTVTLQKSNNVPALAFLGTSTNKAVIEGGDNFNFYTLGSSRIYVSGSGNVGIGTTSPTDKLTVEGNISIFSTYKLYNGSASDSAGITFPNSTTRIDGFNGITFHASSTNVGSQTERMRITSDGNVGIGTTSPAYKLQVSGAGNAGGVLAGFTGTGPSGSISIGHSGNGGSIGYANVGATSNLFYVTTGAGTIGSGFAMDNNGNVGIGTTSPYSKLEITSTTAAWGEGLVLNPASSGYAGTFYRLEGTSGSAYTGTWAIGKSSSGDGGGELLQVVKNGLTGGTAYRVDASQQWKTNGDSIFGFNVGIGTTSPSAKLEIVGFSTGAGLKLNYGNSSGTIEAVNFIANGGANGVIGMQMVSAGVGDLWLGGSGGRALTLYRDGNVGIGTTTPVLPLQVSGRAQFGDTNSMASFTSAPVSIRTTTTESITLTHTAVQSWSMGITSAGAFALRDIDTPADRLVVTQAGNVGIGTTSPSTKLVVSGSHVSGQGMSTFKGSDYAIVNLVAPAAGDGSNGYWGFRAQDPNFNDLMWFGHVTSSTQSGFLVAPNFDTANSASFYVARSNGNVGIGTTSPTQKLEVAGKIRLTDDIQLWSANPTILWESGALRFYNNSTATERMRITDVGNVGIGTTSPSTILNISSSAPVVRLNPTQNNSTAIEFGVLNAGTNAYARIDATNEVNFDTNLRFYTNATSSTTQVERMRISSTGNVGIGTSSPGYKLEVNGVLGVTSTSRLIGNATVGSDTNQWVLAGVANGGAIWQKSNSGAGGFDDRYLRLGNIDNNGTPNYVLTIFNSNVGIGTTNPSTTLHLSSTTPELSFTATGLNRTSTVGMGDGANFYIKNTTAGNLYISDYNSVYIAYGASSQNVGIGTTSPSYKLHVSGAIAIENQGTTTIESTTFAGSLTTNTNIASVPTASFKAAFFDYYVASGSVNMRAGTVMAVHNNSTSRYTDTSTADIGNTAAVDFSTSVVGGNLVLTANISSGTWEIKTAYRAL